MSSTRSLPLDQWARFTTESNSRSLASALKTHNEEVGAQAPATSGESLQQGALASLDSKEVYARLNAPTSKGS